MSLGSNDGSVTAQAHEALAAFEAEKKRPFGETFRRERRRHARKMARPLFRPPRLVPRFGRIPLPSGIGRRRVPRILRFFSREQGRFGNVEEDGRDRSAVPWNGFRRRNRPVSGRIRTQTSGSREIRRSARTDIETSRLVIAFPEAEPPGSAFFMPCRFKIRHFNPFS